MKSNRPPASFRIGAIVPVLALVVGLAACSSGSSGTKTSSGTTDIGGSTSSVPAIGSGTKAKQWTGDPCSLLTASDLSALSVTWDLASADSIGTAGFSPKCEYQLQGSGANNGTQAAVHVSIDARDDFDMSKSIFKGTKVRIGSAAWRGDRDGQANDTIGVQLADVSFTIDATSELGDNPDDLVALAKAVTAHLG